MKTTRRETMKGAVVVAAAASLPGVALARGQQVVAIVDPALAAGRRLAQVHGDEALPIEGDRIRFARAVFEQRPSLVVGVSRPADALLIEEVGREAGYASVTDGTEALRKMIADCRPRDRGLVLGWTLARKA